jgi:phosphate transport system ATP-binding protein
MTDMEEHGGVATASAQAPTQQLPAIAVPAVATGPGLGPGGTDPAGGYGGTPAARPGPLVGLETRDLTAWFGDHKVLDRVSLTMAPGEVTALIGPSGCGKSTYLRILNRMHEMVKSAQLAGQVLLAGEDVYAPGRRPADIRARVGMVFQRPNPFPAMSIYDNVASGLKLAGIKVTRARRATWSRPVWCRPGCGPRCAPGCVRQAARCPAASSSGCASRAHWPWSRTCC